MTGTGIRERFDYAQALRTRIALAREPAPDEISGPPVRRLVGELEMFAEPFRRVVRRHEPFAAARPRTVMLLPGFATHPVRMRYMARRLEAAGHTVKRWGMGFNWGARADTLDRLQARLGTLVERHAEPVVLVGWSLGGLFARELAKRQPEQVAKVVTMGSPFSFSPRANNVWRAYHFLTGHRVEEPPVEVELSAKPPVETVALWSPRDGIVHPRSARGAPGERDREVALRCTHMGFAYDPQAIAAVLRELDAE
ncbi:Alpha/beta hydrolase family protein [Tsuneonella dongtanensis]|uniref:Alpha/beta hydrolase family protein n=1 Tax=Tsuneonella dongtanensis TaxID=692370 RepID=A0A1B2ACC5_9SPHN|nr:alpha/beta fold hydrolase [Tsuneonella dongtanensis]ANY19748.1 Alpha/beta hydrolase family protein [Tsuneonella dongtanensis]